MIFVAVDIGGTFTDLIGFDDERGGFLQAKSLTTPAELGRGVIDCIRQSGVDPGAIAELIHGSTIAINTLIERKGARTALVVTRGARDVYIIGRGNRPESYNLFFHRHRPLVSRQLTREVTERVLSSGDVEEPLQKASVDVSRNYELQRFGFGLAFTASWPCAADGVERIPVYPYLRQGHRLIAERDVRCR